MNVLSRLPAVLKQTGNSKSSLYAMIAEGRFPRPIKIGPRASAWLQNEVDAWVNERISASRIGSAKK